jgi:hypothetical protein
MFRGRKTYRKGRKASRRGGTWMEKPAGVAAGYNSADYNGGRKSRRRSRGGSSPPGARAAKAWGGGSPVQPYWLKSGIAPTMLKSTQSGPIFARLGSRDQYLHV